MAVIFKKITMQHTTATTFAIWLLLVTSLHAQFNPLEWFVGEDEELGEPAARVSRNARIV